MFKIFTDNLAVFFIIWVVIIILNQLFFFNSCFEFYCIKNALPHTAAISAIITFVQYKVRKK